MPVRGGDVWTPRRDTLPDNERVWIMRVTGEAFDSYDAYSHNLTFLRDPNWQCRMTGKSGMTFEAAMQSEQTVLKQLEGKFDEQPDYESLLVRLVHHSTLPLKQLIVSISDELVLVGADPKTFNKSLIRYKIRACAWRVSATGAPWIVDDEEMLQKYKLPRNLPLHLAQIVSAYKKSRRRNRAILSDGNPVEQEDLDSNGDDGEENPDDIDYPIEDTMLPPVRDEKGAVIIQPRREPVQCRDQCSFRSLLFIVDAFYQFERELRVTPFTLEALDEALGSGEHEYLLLEALLGLLELLRTGCEYGTVVLGDFTIDQLHLSDILAALWRIDDSMSDAGLSLSWLPTVADALDVTNSFFKLHYRHKLLVLHALTDEALNSDPIRRRLDENLSARTELLQEHRTNQANDRKESQEKKRELIEQRAQRANFRRELALEKKANAAKLNPGDPEQDENFNARQSRQEQLAMQKKRRAAEEREKRLEAEHEQAMQRYNTLKNKWSSEMTNRDLDRRRKLGEDLLTLALRLNLVGSDRSRRLYFYSPSTRGRIYVYCPATESWGAYETFEQFISLLAYLNDNGIRESALKAKLSNLSEHFRNSVDQREREKLIVVQREKAPVAQRRGIRARRLLATANEGTEHPSSLQHTQPGSYVNLYRFEA